jgi:hypothetical protein
MAWSKATNPSSGFKQKRISLVMNVLRLIVMAEHDALHDARES